MRRHGSITVIQSIHDVLGSKQKSVLDLLSKADLGLDRAQVLRIRQDQVVALRNGIESGSGHLQPQIMLTGLVLFVALKSSFLQ